jgi:hypothetical protein
LAEAEGGGSGLFYYAGHGVQSKRTQLQNSDRCGNSNEAEVEDSGVDVGLV